MKARRALALADLHCGHVAGLTPPRWQIPAHKAGHTDTPQMKRLARRTEKIAGLQRECWLWYVEALKAVGPVDICIANADLIDGRGEKSGSTELIVTDRDEQCAMAVEGLRQTGAKKFFLTRGTPYHVGDKESWEDRIADALGAEKIGDHEWIDVNGLVFDVKHAIGGSVIPHGRHTAIARDRLWNVLWAEIEEQPRAQVFLRAHVHYHVFAGGARWLAMTLPALQAAGTRFGARQMSGTVDFGFVTFDVDERGRYSWRAHLAGIESQRARVVKA
jgi:hypothetical protein